ncbi:ABC transporter ATP-binding protein [Hartmannibacter diazotrophicus]|uniref:ABC transporter ATP-binding protein n=1 Tax=Hartmannibacter diazotrophicus TaxID=1482074 RepID=UPI0018D51911|nr:ABC transporter ATP-binding protein [Hartmannibacter diazotrophicus]
MRYGDSSSGTLAIEGATLSIADGEFIAVVGPSGCGKSSLLKLVSGLHPPAEGVVRVGGKMVDRPIDICGIAFQNSTLLPWRTTLENVLLPLEIVQPYASNFRKNKAEYEARARELLAAVSLAGFEDRYPWELSGGMQQRASLCRALIHKPKLLLLDEPFGALDAFTREDLWTILQDLCIRERPTVILVTHELREAVFLADTVYVVSPRPGKILRREEVPYARPRTYEMTFESDFVDLVHSLRESIQRN